MFVIVLFYDENAEIMKLHLLITIRCKFEMLSLRGLKLSKVMYGLLFVQTVDYGYSSESRFYLVHTISRWFLRESEIYDLSTKRKLLFFSSENCQYFLNQT